MNVLTGNNVTALQAGSTLQGDQLLHAARRLRPQAPNRSDQVAKDATSKNDELRKRIGEMVGMTFFGTLMKAMRESTMKGPFGHGGRGEEVFGGQLDQMLAQEMGKATRFDLKEVIYRQLSRQSKQAAAASENKAKGIVS
jgi:Rod binding domain-containing protein